MSETGLKELPFKYNVIITNLAYYEYPYESSHNREMTPEEIKRKNYVSDVQEKLEKLGNNTYRDNFGEYPLFETDNVTEALDVARKARDILKEAFPEEFNTLPFTASVLRFPICPKCTYHPFGTEQYYQQGYKHCPFCGNELIQSKFIDF